MQIPLDKRIRCRILPYPRVLLIHAQRLAQEGNLDFLLIAGDLFDDHAVDGEIARRAFKMFNEKSPAPVYVTQPFSGTVQ